MLAHLQSSFVGAIAIGDLVKSTLGPKGMDKILMSPGNSPSSEPGITVTNDGATILKSIGVDNPAAKVLVGKLSIYYVIVSVYLEPISITALTW